MKETFISEKGKWKREEGGKEEKRKNLFFKTVENTIEHP